MPSINLLAPNATPFAQFSTRNGNYTADANGLINNVPVGPQIADLLEDGCVPVAANPFANPRNLLDGGDFTINPWQRNIPALATGGVITTAVTNTPTYFADRFFAVGNASAAILMANVADTTVPGFANSLLLTRQAANTNTAVINFGQVVETADSVKLQNQTVTLSFWARTAANYSGGNLSVALISGTGANQSAANMVAGSWTGQSSITLTPSASNGVAGAPASQPLSAGMTRYSFTGVVPVNSTQIGFLLGFTPTGTAGTTDGIYFNGFQLEIGASASPFEREDVQIVLEECQRYCAVLAEPASGNVVAAGTNTGSGSQIILWQLPAQMYKSPTFISALGSFKTNQGGTLTAITTLTASGTHTVNQVGVSANSTGTSGNGTLLQGGGGSGYLMATADF
jgi:hypothetical protein